MKGVFCSLLLFLFLESAFCSITDRKEDKRYEDPIFELLCNTSMKTNIIYYAHPEMCQAFIKCVHKKPLEIQCPSKLAWNQYKLACSNDISDCLTLWDYPEFMIQLQESLQFLYKLDYISPKLKQEIEEILQKLQFKIKEHSPKNITIQGNNVDTTLLINTTTKVPPVTILTSSLKDNKNSEESHQTTNTDFSSKTHKPSKSFTLNKNIKSNLSTKSVENNEHHADVLVNAAKDSASKEESNDLLAHLPKHPSKDKLINDAKKSEKTNVHAKTASVQSPPSQRSVPLTMKYKELMKSNLPLDELTMSLLEKLKLNIFYKPQLNLAWPLPQIVMPTQAKATATATATTTNPVLVKKTKPVVHHSPIDRNIFKNFYEWFTELSSDIMIKTFKKWQASKNIKHYSQIRKTSLNNHQNRLVPTYRNKVYGKFKLPPSYEWNEIPTQRFQHVPTFKSKSHNSFETEKIPIENDHFQLKRMIESAMHNALQKVMHNSHKNRNTFETPYLPTFESLRHKPKEKTTAFAKEKLVSDLIKSDKKYLPNKMKQNNFEHRQPKHTMVSDRNDKSKKNIEDLHNMLFDILHDIMQNNKEMRNLLKTTTKHSHNNMKSTKSITPKTDNSTLIDVNWQNALNLKPKREGGNNFENAHSPSDIENNPTISKDVLHKMATNALTKEVLQLENLLQEKYKTLIKKLNHQAQHMPSLLEEPSLKTPKKYSTMPVHEKLLTKHNDLIVPFKKHIELRSDSMQSQHPPQSQSDSNNKILQNESNVIALVPVNNAADKLPDILSNKNNILHFKVVYNGNQSPKNDDLKNKATAFKLLNI